MTLMATGDAVAVDTTPNSVVANSVSVPGTFWAVVGIVMKGNTQPVAEAVLKLTILNVEAHN